MNNHSIYLGKVLDILKTIPENSINFVVSRLPMAYCSNQGGPEADEIEAEYPIQELWSELHRVTTNHGVIALFSGNDMTNFELKKSNIGRYRYDLVWDYEHPSVHQTVYKGRNFPLVHTENISIFSDKAPVLFPEHMHDHWHWHETPSHDHIHCEGSWTHGKDHPSCHAHHFDFPQNVLRVPMECHSHYHGTAFGEYPSVLIEKLIRMYSHKGDTVLIPFCGVGNAVLAGINLNRNVVAIEEHEGAFVIARNRMSKLVDSKAESFMEWVDAREEQTPLPDDPDSLVGGKD